jgi:hypothetical protein
MTSKNESAPRKRNSSESAKILESMNLPVRFPIHLPELLTPTRAPQGFILKSAVELSHKEHIEHKERELQRLHGRNRTHLDGEPIFNPFYL